MNRQGTAFFLPVLPGFLSRVSGVMLTVEAADLGLKCFANVKSV